MGGKDAKPDSEWKKDMKAFAKSGKEKMERGCHPRGGNWKKVHDKVRKCPAHTKTVSVIAAFSAGCRKISCNCGYHEVVKKKKKNPTPSPKKQSPTNGPSNAEPKVYSRLNWHCGI